MPFTFQRRCAACHRPFDSDPIFRQDTTYCCRACATGALCSCFVEIDLADDGVDGLGLPFGVGALRPAHAEVEAPPLAISRGRGTGTRGLAPSR